jgi:hypothetical protein
MSRLPSLDFPPGARSSSLNNDAVSAKTLRGTSKQGDHARTTSLRLPQDKVCVVGLRHNCRLHYTEKGSTATLNLSANDIVFMQKVNVTERMCISSAMSGKDGVPRVPRKRGAWPEARSQLNYVVVNA